MRKNPPLWVWISCIGILVTALAYIQLTASGRTQLLRTRFYATFQHQVKNFLNNYEPDSTQHRVLCWGSSLTCQAMEHSHIMSEQIATFGQAVDVQKMYLLNSNSKTLPYLDELFEISANLSPSLICIEDHLFSHADRNINNTVLLREIDYLFLPQNKQRSRKRIIRSFRNKNFDAFYTNIKELPSRDTINFTLHKRSINSFSDNKRLNKQLEFVLEQEIPLVILNLPRVGAVESYMITPTKQAAIDKLIEEYRLAGFKIEYWKFPRYLPFKYYADDAHMNSDGREIYTKWFIQKIAEYFDRQDL